MVRVRQPVQLRLARQRDDEAELERDGALALAVERRLEHLALDARCVRGQLLEQRPVLLEPRAPLQHDEVHEPVHAGPVAGEVPNADEEQETARADVGQIGLGEERVVYLGWV